MRALTLGFSVAKVGAACLLLTAGCRSRPEYDTVLRQGTVYDGSGGAPFTGDVAIAGDSIAAIGPSLEGRGKREINVHGLAVAPGFVNMLSWAMETLIEDGRSQSDIRQGVTLEVFGEGWSMGPLTDTMKKINLFEQGDIKYPVTWTTLDEALNTLVRKGVSPNVASFIGATTVRIHVLGWDDRQPTAAELERMQALVRDAMEQGALGVGSSLIYAPAFYAKTDELVALAKATAPYGGMYISHIRNEGSRLLESVDELIAIARDAGVRAEVYHLKAAGQANWPKMDRVISKIDSARKAGLAITADVYPYPAGATGLNAAMPPWVQEGGYLAWAQRLRDPKIRARVKREMLTPTAEWENNYLAVGTPDRLLLVAFKADSLKYLTGKTLAEVAKLRGKSPEETAMDLVIQDGSRVGAIYFMMSEDNIRKQIARPWVSLGTDEGSFAPEGVFLKSNPHPRSYGTFPRFLAKYVREDRVIPLEEAVRRLSWMPMSNLRIPRRGKLAQGFYADVVVFNPATITDHATFDRPHQYATGVLHVFVNGTQVLADGEHTGAKPGRVVRGPGWKGPP
jgi:N-acyl-D-aspartate/D-glutamate deacylase